MNLAWLEGGAAPHGSDGNLVDADDGDFWGIDDRGGRQPTRRAEARDRDGGARQLVASDGAGASGFGQTPHLCRTVPDGARLGMPHDADHQAIGRLDGDANVDASMTVQGAGVVVGLGRAVPQ